MKLTKNNMKKQYKTLYSKVHNQYVVVLKDTEENYVLGLCDTPELYPMNASLEGIDTYYHHELVGQYDKLKAELITITLINKYDH
jgi:hypothetical protein